AGQAVVARLARDVLVERSNTRATITLTRGSTEKAVAWIAAFLLVQLGYIGLRLTFFQRPSELRCDRAKDECTLRGSDIFGTEWHTSFPASGMVRSEVEPREHRERAWMVRMTGGRSRELGSPTGRARQQEQYRRSSDALDAFIANHAQSTFETRFEGLGG